MLNDEDGAAIYIVLGSVAIIDQCFFNDNSSPIKNGGGSIRMEGQATITSSVFSNCFGKDGGAYSGTRDGTFTNCILHSNSASFAGGAIGMYGSARTFVKYCLFYNNIAGHGADVILWDMWNNPDFTGTRVENKAYRISAPGNLDKTSTLIQNGNVLLLTFIDPSSVVTLDPSAETPDCADGANRRCNSITTTMEFSPSLTDLSILIPASSISVEHHFHPHDKTIRISSEPDMTSLQSLDRPTLKAYPDSGHFLTYIQKGSLTMTSIIVTFMTSPHFAKMTKDAGVLSLIDCSLDCNGKSKTHSLIEVTAGTLLLTSTSISSGEFSSTSPLHLSDCSATISLCSFSNLRTINHNGGAVDIQLSGIHTLEVKGTTFQNCSTNQLGGAVSIDVTSSSVSPKSDAYQITSSDDVATSFVDCTAANGDWLFVLMTDRTVDVIPQCLDFERSGYEEHLIGYDTDYFKIDFITPTLSSLFLADSDNSGNDANDCQTEDTPCETFAKAAPLSLSGATFTIVSQSTWKTPSIIQQQTTLTSPNPSVKSRLILSNQTESLSPSPGFIQIKSNVLFESLSIQLVQRSTHCAFLFVSLTGAASLRDISLSTVESENQAMPYNPFILVKYGTVTTSSLAFEQPLLFSSPLISVISGSFSDETSATLSASQHSLFTEEWISLSTDNQFAKYPSLKLHGWTLDASLTQSSGRALTMDCLHQVELNECSLKSYKDSDSTPFSGAAIFGIINSKGSLKIISSQFLSCSSTENGGAMNVEVEGEFIVQYTSFTECSSKKNGGGLAMAVKGGGKATVEGCVFSSCSSEGFGGGFFLDICDSTLSDRKNSYLLSSGATGFSFIDCTSDIAGPSFVLSMLNLRADFTRQRLIDSIGLLPPLAAMGLVDDFTFDLFDEKLPCYVSDSGSDSNNCSVPTAACKSLSRTLLDAPSPAAVYIVDSASQNGTSYTITKPCTLISADSDYAVLYLDGKDNTSLSTQLALIQVATTLELLTINLRIKQCSLRSPFVQVIVGGELIFTDAKISHVTALGTLDVYSHIVSNLGGIIRIEKLWVQPSFCLGSMCLFWLEGASQLIKKSEDDMSIKLMQGGSITEGGLIGCDVESQFLYPGYPTIVLHYSTFEGYQTNPSKLDQGALFFVGAQHVELKKCTFKNFITVSKNEESVIVLNPSGTPCTINIISCLFEGTNRIMTGAILLKSDTPQSVVSISGSEDDPTLFRDCKSQNKGGAVQLQVKGRTTLSYCHFESCSTSDSSTGHGGALSATVEGGFLFVSHTSFVSCSSAGKGGATYIDLKAIGNGDYAFSRLTFGVETGSSDSNENEVTEDGYGRDIFVTVKKNQCSILSVTKWDQVVAPLSTSESTIISPFQRDSIIFEEYGVRTESIVYLFYPYSSGTVNLHTAGMNHLLCGHEYLPCPSFETGYPKVKASDGTGGGLRIMETMELDMTISSLTFPLTITSADRETAILSMSSNGGFSVTSSSMTLKDLSVCWIGSEIISKHFVSVADGELSIADCIITLLQTTISNHVISVSGGSVNLNGLTLNSDETKRTHSLIHVSGGEMEVSSWGLTGLVFEEGKGVFEVSESGQLRFEKILMDFCGGSGESVVVMNGGLTIVSNCDISNGILSRTIFSGTGSFSVHSAYFSQFASGIVGKCPNGVRPISLTIPSGCSSILGSPETSSEFKSCSSCGNGGAICLSVEGESTVQHTTFSSCSSSRNGGGIAIVVSNDGIVIVRACKFWSCFAQLGCGGGVFLDTTYSTKINKFESFLFTDDSDSLAQKLSFINCQASERSGNWIYLKTTSMSTDYSIMRMTFDYSLAKDSDGIGSDGTIELTDLFIPVSTNIVYISDTSSDDRFTCYQSYYPCATLPRALHQLDFTDSNTVRILGQYTCRSHLELKRESVALVLEPLSEKETTPTLILQNEDDASREGQSGFVEIASSVELRKIAVTLVQKSSDVAFVSVIESGSLSLSSIEIKTTIGSDSLSRFSFQPFLLILSGTASVSALSLCNKPAFAASPTIMIKGGSFSSAETLVDFDVSSQSEKGLVQVQGSPDSISSPTLSIEQWSFKGASIDIIASVTTALVVENSGLINLERCTFTNIVALSLVSGTVSINSCSMLFDATVPSSLISVSGGSVSLNGLTLNSDETKRTHSLIHVSGGEMEVSSWGLTGLVFEEGKGVFEVSESGQLRFEKILMDFCGGSGESVVVMNGGLTIVSNCDISNGILSRTIFSGTGSFSLASFTVTSLNQPLSTSDDTECWPVSLKLSSTDQSSIGSKIKQSQFNSCSSMGNGGAMNVEVEGEFIVQCTSFTECSSKKNGGGLAMAVKGEGKATVEGCVFSSCSSEGFGGGFFLDICDSTLSDRKNSYFFVQNDPPTSFKGCSAPVQKGQWLFISMTDQALDYDLSKLTFDYSSAIHFDLMGRTSTSIFDLVYPPIVSLYISDSKGDDTATCVSPSFPCLTLAGFEQKRNNTISHLIIVGTSTWMSGHIFSGDMISITSEDSDISPSLILQNEDDASREGQSGFVEIASSVELRKIAVTLVQKSSDVAFVSVIESGSLSLSSIEIKTTIGSDSLSRFSFQPFLLILSGTVSFGTTLFSQTDFGPSQAILMNGGSLSSIADTDKKITAHSSSSTGLITVNPSVTHTLGPITLETWSFVAWKDNDISSAISITTSNAVTIKQCSFAGFSDTLAKPTIYLDLLMCAPAYTLVLIDSLSFNKASSESVGLVIKSDEPEVLLSPASFPTILPETPKSVIISTQSDAQVEEDIRPYLLSPFHFVGANHQSIQNCQSPRHACSTLKTSIDSEKQNRFFVIETFSVGTEEIPNRLASPFHLKGSLKQSSTLLFTGATSSFAVNKESHLDTLTLLLSRSYTSPIIHCTASLTITSCTLTDSDNHIQNGLIYLSDGTSNPVAMTFRTSTMSTTSNSPIVIFSINNPSSSFSSLDTSLTSKTKSVRILSRSFLALVNKLSIVISSSHDSAVTLEGIDERLYSSAHSINPANFFHPKQSSSAILTSSAGIDSESCEMALPCYSLDYTLLRLNPKNPRSILVWGTVPLSESLSIVEKQPFIIYSAQDGKIEHSIYVTSPSTDVPASFDCAGTTTIQSISIEVDSSFSPPSLFSTSSSLSFFNSSIATKSSSFSSTLFTIKSGSFEMNFFTLSEVSFNSAHVISCDSSLAPTLSLSNVFLSHIKTDTPLIASTKSVSTSTSSLTFASFTLSNCSLSTSSVDKCSVSFALIDLTSTNVSFTTSDFEDCSSVVFKFEESTATFTSGSFSSNFILKSDKMRHTLIQHNIHSVNSSISIADSVLFDDLTASSSNSLWITTDHNNLTNLSVPSDRSTFFVPIITAAAGYSSRDTLPQHLKELYTLSNTQYLVELQGQNLINWCDSVLFQLEENNPLTVFWTFNSDPVVNLDFTSMDDYTRAVIVVQSSQFNTNADAEWVGRVIFGKSDQTYRYSTETFVVKEVGVKPYFSTFSQINMWIIILSVTASILFVLLLGVAFVPKSRLVLKDKKAQQVQQQKSVALTMPVTNVYDEQEMKDEEPEEDPNPRVRIADPTPSIFSAAKQDFSDEFVDDSSETDDTNDQLDFTNSPSHKSSFSDTKWNLPSVDSNKTTLNTANHVSMGSSNRLSPNASFSSESMNKSEQELPMLETPPSFDKDFYFAADDELLQEDVFSFMNDKHNTVT